jgi:hypothetical protein
MPSPSPRCHTDNRPDDHPGHGRGQRDGQLPGHTDLRLLKAAVESAFEGMSVEAFGSEVLAWLGTASHPVLRRPYLSCGFAPMVELLRYLEANGFTTYIASGGDRDFMCRSRTPSTESRRSG